MYLAAKQETPHRLSGERRGTFRLIARNLLYGWLAIGARTLISLYMVPFLLGRIGRAGYGYIGLVSAFTSLTLVADLGLRAALGRELASLRAKEDWSGLEVMFNTAKILYGILAFILSAVAIWLAPDFVRWMNVSDDMALEAVSLLRFYGPASIVLSFALPPFTALLASDNRFDIISKVETAAALTGNVAMIAAVTVAKKPIWAWAVITVGIQLVTTVSMYAVCKKRFSGISFRWSSIRFAALKPLMHLGGQMYAIQLANMLGEKTDPMVISRFYGPSGIALYSPAARISQIIRPIISLLPEQLYPLATSRYEKSDWEQLQRVLFLGTKFILVLGGLAAGLLITFAFPFCQLWLEKSLGRDYEKVAWVLIGWAIIDWTYYSAGTQWPVLLGMKKLLILFWTQVPASILNLLLSIYLVGYTRLGIAGVVVGTILAGLFRRPILIWYVARLVGSSPTVYLRKSYLPGIWSLMAAWGAGIAASYMVQPSRGWWSLAAAGIISCVCWAVLTVPIVLSREERANLRRSANRVLRL